MGRSTPGPLVLAFPPEFDYLAGLFLPDLTRALLLGKIFLLCRKARGEGKNVLLDPGGEGLPASERVRALLDLSPSGILVLGAPRDHASALVLAEAWKERGAFVEGPLVGKTFPKRKILSHLKALGPQKNSWVEDRSSPLLSPQPFTILPSAEENGCPLPEGPFFREKEPGLLERAAPGGWGFLGPSITEIRILCEEDPLPPAKETLLLALHIPPPSSPPERKKKFLERLARAAERSGESNLALLPPRRERRVAPLPAGAPWAAGYGLEDPRTRNLLLDACAAAFPSRLGPFHAALGFYSCRIDPLEEIYAGNHLADRNQDLIVNIVP